MSWEQHRYAVERARDTLNERANRLLEHEQMVSLQSEAASSDVELLDDVVDLLRSMEGSKKEDRLENPGQAFVDDWNRTIITISNFCSMYDLPKPDMLFHPQCQGHMSYVAGEKIGSPIIYAGVRVRFGRYESMDVLRPA